MTGLRLLLVLLLAVLGCGAAPAPGVVVVADEIGVLGGVASPALVEDGATVALLLVERGGRDDVWGRLRSAGLTRGTSLHPGVVVVYVSRQPRYSELRVGSRYSELLPPATLERVRREALNPALASGRFREAFAGTLEALGREVAAAEAWRARGLAWLLLGLVAVLPAWWLWGRLYPYTPAGRREAERWRLDAAEARERARRDLVAAWERLPVQPPDLSPETCSLAEVQEVASGHAALARAADAAATSLGRARTALRARCGKRWRKGPPAHRERFEALEASLADLGSRRGALAGLSRADLLERMAALAGEYAAVDAALHELGGLRRSFQPSSSVAEGVPVETPPADSGSSPAFDFDPSPGDSRAGGEW